MSGSIKPPTRPAPAARHAPTRPVEIRSGGQTGVDRAALDFALDRGLPHGGWCPRGRRAEDGVIPARYRLRETASAAYEERTRRNVRDSDATVIFSPGRALAGGTRLTREIARALGRPLLHLTAAGDAAQAAARLRAFVRRHRVRRLNVAGPRASEAPGLELFVRAVLERAFPPGRRESGGRALATGKVSAGQRPAPPRFSVARAWAAGRAARRARRARRW
jgi:hypothetical protein